MNSIQVTNYELDTRVGLRLALVTDLHSMPYDDLLTLIKEENPDVILLAGDTLERQEEGKSKWDFLTMEQWQYLPEMKGSMVSLMRVLDRLVEHNGVEAEEKEDLGLAFLHDINGLAPVFMSVGNHEWYFTDEDEKFFKDNSITVLDNADVQVTIKGKKLRIGGLSTRYDMEWLKRYSQKDGIKILLCHHPEHYKYMIKDKIDTFDLVLSGQHWSVCPKDWTNGSKCPRMVRKTNYQCRCFKYNQISKMGKSARTGDDKNLRRNRKWIVDL